MNKNLKVILIICVLIVVLVLILVYYQSYNENTIHQIFYADYYKDVFPEEEFPPVERDFEYHRRVKNGYLTMKKKSIAILGLAYNLGEENTHKLIKRLNYLTKKWKDYRIIIYAADSTDLTFPILKNYGKYNKRIILPTETFNKDGLNRIEKMSCLRNILRNNLLKLEFIPDYVMLQDCDLASGISIDGIAHSISYLLPNKNFKKSSTDVIFANGIINEFLIDCHLPYIGYFYYDAFAYIEDPRNSNAPLIKNMVLRRGEELVPVISAFGGMAIYKYNVFKRFQYDIQSYECEHINLHKKMYKAGYRLAINPSLLLISGRQGETFHKSVEKIKLGRKGYLSYCNKI